MATVSRTQEGSVAVVTLSRGKVNALSMQVLTELAATFADIAKDSSVKAVVLTGASGNFSAGVDLGSALEIFNGQLFTDYSTKGFSELDPMYHIQKLPQPLIAAVDGVAITGGFELVLACDMVVATSRASFQDTHAVFGIAPFWGLSQKMPRLVGANRARQFSLAAQPLGAAEAKSWGLVNEIVATPEELLPSALDLAKQIAQNSGSLSYKRVINTGLEKDLTGGMQAEFDAALQFYGSKEFKASAKAMAAAVAPKKAGKRSKL